MGQKLHLQPEGGPPCINGLQMAQSPAIIWGYGPSPYLQHVCFQLDDFPPNLYIRNALFKSPKLKKMKHKLVVGRVPGINDSYKKWGFTGNTPDDPTDP